MYSLRYQSEDGQAPLQLVPAAGRYFDVEPLPHSALSGYTHSEATFPLTLTNATIVGADTPSGHRHTVSMHIRSEAGEPLYGLVESGWIPFPFMSGDVALLDRNVVSKIENLQPGQPRSEGAHPRPEFDLSFVGKMVSPLPYVLEGRFRKPQTRGELHASLAQGTKALRRVLPAAQVQPIDARRLKGLHGLLDDKKRFQARAAPFLREICPSVAQPAGARQQVEVELKVLRLARERSISPTSPVVLAVLSCLYDNVARPLHKKILKPGRAVLKPKPEYSEGDAYAALSDLLFLELLVSMKGNGLAQRPVFYTHDLGLAAFWSALDPRDFSGNGQQGATGRFSLSPALLPALDEEQCAALLARLERQV
ncbi:MULTISPECIES: hypothetical protein [unclassified Variovorax]|jgi:hypothetical protein|uniref:hypothetical protein n=1 Tax=unclassified Variovorax TaxID=663243 RepID=UPI0008CDDBB3|nr:MULTISPECIES: hypothetical protein [unclassified Variovorax]SEK13086.1 hypothetical protein SAMN05518853_11239 [Variovorax sp. OK202]SFD87709.1 hypothetical protein SAMN05444746_112143 [Variovorax sp. OK212]